MRKVYFKRRFVVAIVFVSLVLALIQIFFFPLSSVLRVSDLVIPTDPSSKKNEILTFSLNGTRKRRTRRARANRNQAIADSSSYYDSLQSLRGKLRCWNPELQCQKLPNRTTDGEGMRDASSSKAQEPKRTLALVDPAFTDGYRNQFMRFVALTTYAVTNGFDQMLLPSIRWSCDHRKAANIAVPFELLFDVDHWNIDPDLPTMVDYNQSEHFDWDPFTGLFRGACDVLDIYRNQGPELKSVLFDRAQQYEHPVPYGGGDSLGRLFYDYLDYDAKRPMLLLSRKKPTTIEFVELEAKITRAMKPSAGIERLIRETISPNSQLPIYIALHARFEPEMLVHEPCKDVKVYNITDVFDMIRGMDHSKMENPSLYIAINMAEMLRNRFKRTHALHQLNMAALEEAKSYGLGVPSGTNLTVSVGGHTAFRSDETDACAHEIVSSVVSFEIAVQAQIFIGTYVSSWSTTVWKARHYLGRGENYAYTPSGLEKIIGLPKPFHC